MTTSSAPALSATSTRRPVRRLVLHYLEMLVAMLVGMAVLGPVWDLLAPGLTARADAAALVMAADMSLGMAAWMRVRHHSWPAIAEMCAWMSAPFVLLLLPYETGDLSGDALLTWGHLLMLPAMAVPLVRRRSEAHD